MNRAKVLDWFGGLSDKDRAEFVCRAHEMFYPDWLVEMFMKYDWEEHIRA